MSRLDYTTGGDLHASARWLTAAMLALMGVGIVLVASASAGQGYASAQPLAGLRAHVLRVGVALLAFLLATRVRPRWLFLAAAPAWIAAVGLLAAVLVTGVQVKGGRRWLDLGLTTFQPSEFARVAVIVAIAAWAALTRERMTQVRHGILVPFALVGVPCVLVLLEPDFGSTVYMLFMGVLVLWLGGARTAHLLVAFTSALTVASLYGWERFAHVSRRLSRFTDPEPGSQVWQSLTALGRGGVGGVGLGSGQGSWGYVPEAENDFIFAVLGEEAGLVGSLLVLTLYGLFLWHGARILLGLQSRFALVVGAGLLFQVLVQALLNVAVVTAVAPPKGLPLPFVSSGGTSLLVLATSTGLLLGLARRAQDDPVRDAPRARSLVHGGVAAAQVGGRS